MMFVRLALESDFDAIVEMGRQNCEETCQPDVFSSRRARERLAEYLATANPTFFVCEENREPIGFLMAYVVNYDHKDGFFTTQRVLFVRSERRGTRAAVLLMKELIRWSEMLGADAVEGGNDNGFQSERTAAFLGHFGFKNVGFAMRKDICGGQKEQR